MSNNISEPPSSSADNTGCGASSALLVVSYKKRKVVIKKNPDFKATITSVRNALPALRSSQVILSTQFSDFDNEILEISEELWADLLPSLKTVHVSEDVDTEELVGHKANDKPTESVGRNPVKPE